MSLINDALKRARNIQPAAALNQAVVGADLFPAELSRRFRTEPAHNYLKSLSMASTCFALMALGIWAIRESRQANQVTAAQVELAELPAGPSSPTKAAMIPVSEHTSSDVQNSVDSAEIESANPAYSSQGAAGSESEITSEPDPNASGISNTMKNQARQSNHGANIALAGEAAVDTVPVAPPFRLQGIFYHGDERSAALIKGRMVSKGDAVEGYVVASIEKGTVKFDLKGHSFSLSL